jgi:hypothetical protein
MGLVDSRRGPSPPQESGTIDYAYVPRERSYHHWGERTGMLFALAPSSLKAEAVGKAGRA